MNVQMVGQIRQQQVERKEGSAKKEVVHRVQIEVAQSRNDENQEKKEEERHGSEEAYLARQRPGLKLFGHRHSDCVARQQVLVIPIQLPAACRIALLSGSECVVREVDVLEVRRHPQV